ncbi:mycothiol synthase [Brachybacterium sp. P6-10-X1]|uniref:mycothiol synthase n=1 Tax=Brachybacterium sp. P6-10-X1 TaxID=1903186 RepID=UPI000971A124|nr:mycothiol synthase [Brachybacterium sp. P6-10-X1]APX32900.1 mycothiol synthase [Brachybacterium sp. P6-10-X1]
MITTAALSQSHGAAIQELLEAVTAHDGVSPLDEAARLAITAGDAQHLLLGPDGDAPTEADEAAVPPTGYASVLADGTVQGMVRPDQRRRGHGTALLRAALDLRPDAGVWAHGALEGSLAFLTDAGLHETRRLLTLHRPLGPAHPVPEVPAPTLEDLQLDTFVADRDADAWLEVNAAAFADHPEQGALTREDLDQRLAEPWFDPEDLLVARRGQDLVGFVWVKREAEVEAGAGAGAADAEIYVVATSPAVQGHGVAGHLLATSLTRLQEAGVPGVELYVEADNAPALALYERWGFRVSGRDVQLRMAEKS